MHALDATMWVAGQIRPEDVAGLVARGVTTIVNNRPDREAPDQPAGALVADAAEAAGIAYLHLPVSGGFSADQVAEMTNVLERPGITVAFCASGTRSTFLWALARARIGDDPAEIETRAAAAGYDLGPIRPWLQSH